MKKFSFRLEKILQIKAYIEKEKQKSHSLARKKVVDQKAALRAIDFERTKTHNYQRRDAGRILQSDRLLVFSRYCLRLRKNEIAAGEMLRALEKTRKKKQNELLEATRQKKIYEKLKDKRRQAYLDDMKLLMQKEQDELSANFDRHKKTPG